METVLADRPMGKKKMGRPPSGRNDATAKIDVDVLRKAKYVATYRGVTLAEYLSASMAVVVERDMKQIAGEMMDKPKR